MYDPLIALRENIRPPYINTIHHHTNNHVLTKRSLELTFLQSIINVRFLFINVQEHITFIQCLTHDLLLLSIYFKNTLLLIPALWKLNVLADIKYYLYALPNSGLHEHRTGRTHDSSYTKCTLLPNFGSNNNSNSTQFLLSYNFVM